MYIHGTKMAFFKKHGNCRCNKMMDDRKIIFSLYFWWNPSETGI